jgi:predicted RNase H-like HicB family nuclease
MLTQYIQAALCKAKYEVLQDGKGFLGFIPDFEGVKASADTLAECREELIEVLEKWVIYRISKQLELPVIDGLNLNAQSTA